MTDWIALKDIYFERSQFFFLIDNLEMMKEGIWPPNPAEGSGYREEIGKHQVSAHANFERPCQIVAECESRLVTCGDAGEALVDEIQNGVEYYEYLTDDAKEALNYCSGWERRDVCFPFWREFHKEVKKEDILNKPCECGHNRWRTVKKGLSWRCRKCGKVRNSGDLMELLSAV